MLKQTLNCRKSSYVTRHLKGYFGRQNEYIDTKFKVTRPQPHDVAESEEKDLSIIDKNNSVSK